MADAGAVTAAVSFLSIRSYIETTYGAGSFRRVRQVVTERFPDFPQVMVPGAWYPTAALLTVMDAAHDLFGPDDFYERCGRKIVDYEVNVLFRFTLKLTSPAWIVDRATEAWRRAHSTGVWEVVPASGYIEARLIGFETTAGYCRMLTGYFQRLFELSGARDVRVKHPRCRGRGEDVCLYVTSWREQR